MTDTIYRKEVYRPDPTTFGGVIYPSDFDTNYAKGNIASRIESDKRFDECCRKNIEQKRIMEGKYNDAGNNETKL